MEMLLKFEVNNIWYFVCRVNNKIIYYFVRDGIRHFNLSHEQELLIKNVIDNITPSSSRIMMPWIIYNGGIYSVNLDEKTGFYFFNPVPPCKDFLFLNKLFNDDNSCFMCIDDKFNDSKMAKSPFIRKTLYVGKLVITAFISMSMVLCLLSSYHNNKYYHAVRNTSQLSDEIIISSVMESIMENDNLTLDEKKVFLDNIWVLIDNKEYLDLGYIRDTFSNIVISYVDDNGENNVSGLYRPANNEIIFYNSENIGDVSDYVLTHELFHSTTEVPLEIQNSFLVETTNTIFNEEYSGCSEKSVYNNYTNYTKVLMEIIGFEPLKEYHNFSSTKPIIDALCEIIGDYGKAKKLLNCLNEYKTIYDYLNDSKEYNQEYYDMSDNLDIVDSEIRTLFGEYYYAKYDRDIYDDLVMLYYLNQIRLMDVLSADISINDNQTIQFNFENNIIYFNTKKISPENGIDVKITISQLVHSTSFDSIIGNDEETYFSYYTIEYRINDSNRYLDNSKVLKYNKSNQFF